MHIANALDETSFSTAACNFWCNNRQRLNLRRLYRVMRYNASTRTFCILHKNPISELKQSDKLQEYVLKLAFFNYFCNFSIDNLQNRGIINTETTKRN